MVPVSSSAVRVYMKDIAAWTLRRGGVSTLFCESERGVGSAPLRFEILILHPIQPYLEFDKLCICDM